MTGLKTRELLFNKRRGVREGLSNRVISEHRPE